MCCICNSGCCKRWFPEWARETSMKLFWIKFTIIIIVAAIMVTVTELETEVFNNASITYTTFLAVGMYGLVLGYLLILYWPYQHRIAPIWLQSIIYIIWFVFTALFFANGWFLHLWDRSDIQTDAFDAWTIGHTLSGLVLGFCIPWWPTFAMLIIWEVLESYTVGLGDGESMANHIVDVIVAVIGWWVIILAFKRSRNDIPWISSRNSCGNKGECCFVVAVHVEQNSYEHGTYNTVHV